MNDDFASVLRELNAHADTHPNITALWKTYIRRRKRSYDQALAQCRDVLSQLDTISDMSLESILAIYSVLFSLTHHAR